MPNANKQRGDRAERAVRDLALQRYAGSFKTRAGFDDDLGDVIVNHPAGRVVLQVKDVAQPTWKGWFTQLADQVATCRAASHGLPVVGGVIVHKARGTADPAQWRAVATLDGLLDLLDRVYDVGVAIGRKHEREDAQARDNDRTPRRRRESRGGLYLN